MNASMNYPRSIDEVLDPPESRHSGVATRERSQAMGHNQNPVYTKGDRNVFCPYYRSCLDYAVELQWKYWACLDCQHTQKEVLVTDVLLLPVDADPYYSVPMSFHKRAVKTSL